MLAIFGIDNDLISLGVSLALLIAIVFWLGLVAFTFLDARRRIDDVFLVLCATVAALVFPFIGVIVYCMLRPPEFLEDARERDLEIRATELRVNHLLEASCPNCEFPIDRSYLRCPRCRARIKEPCDSCSQPIDPRWSICPYCETPNRRAERRRSSLPLDEERTESARGLRRKRIAAEAKATAGDAPAAAEPVTRSREPAVKSSPARSSSRSSTSSASSTSSSSSRPKTSPAARVQADRERAESSPAPRRSSRSTASRPRPADTETGSTGSTGPADPDEGK